MNSRDLSDKHGHREGLWSFAPVHRPDLGGFIDTNLYTGAGTSWLASVAAESTPSEDEMRIIREAFAVSPDNLDELITFNPNNISHSLVIGPLRQLGLIDDDEIARIIDEADINFSVSAHAGRVTITSIVEKTSEPNGIVKSPGLKVLDDLLEGGTLDDDLQAKIWFRKADFVGALSAYMHEGICPDL